MADRSGQRIDHYHLLRLLGTGSFGEVYLADDIHRKNNVAIKLLPLLKDNDMIDFLNEARTIRLQHPHIVQVRDFGVDKHLPFIVMDYAPNGTLRQRHPRGTRILLEEVVSYVNQAADALQYAHVERMIHRDIKPENLLLGPKNRVLVSDFGIAMIAPTSRSQSVLEMAGTISYMAPEQIQGKPRFASDQYALAVIVFEWLCGERPFTGTPLEIASQHLLASIPSLCDKVPGLPINVERVIHTGLAKDPKDRFTRIQDFAEALEQAYEEQVQRQQARSPVPPSVVSHPVTDEKFLPIKEKVFPVSEPPIDSVEASMLDPVKRTDSVSSVPLSGPASFQPVTRILPSTRSSTGNNIDKTAKATQLHWIFVHLIAPMIFGALTCRFVLPLIASGMAYIPPAGLWPVTIIIILLAVAQAVGVYYAGSDNRLWILATIGGFFLFILVGCFAIFGPVPTLVLLLVLLIVSVVLMRLYFRPVSEGYVDIVYAFGKYKRTLYPGLNILMPWEKLMHSLNVGEKQWACPLQKVQLSRDEDVVLRATISYQLTPEDAYIAATQVLQWENSLKDLVLATIQSIATMLTPNDFIAWPQGLHSHPLPYNDHDNTLPWDKVNNYLFQLISDRVALWGVQVNWVRILDVSLAPHGATIVETDPIVEK